MRMAVIDGSTVINVIEAKSGHKIPGFTVVASDTAGVGDIYADGAFSAPPAPEPAPITEMHAAWLRAALAEAGKLAAVNQAVASQGAVKEALWEFATTLKRDDPDVVAVAAALSIDLDAIFKRADQIRQDRGR